MGPGAAGWGGDKTLKFLLLMVISSCLYMSPGILVSPCAGDLTAFL